MSRWTLHKGYGASKPWVAEITGTDETYIFARDFLPVAERDFSRSGKTGSYVFEIPDEGLFEDSTGDFTLRFKDKAGRQFSFTIEKQRAYEMAKILNMGLSLKTARLATMDEKNITDKNRDAVEKAYEEVKMAEALKND